MVQKDAAIQSYFSQEPSPCKGSPATAKAADSPGDGFKRNGIGGLTKGNGLPSDGFTGDEIDSVLYPKLHRWQPRVEYQDVDIGSLVPGPGRVALTARIVNFYDQVTPSKMPRAAKGCSKVIVKDDTGAMVVSLQFPLLHVLNTIREEGELMMETDQTMVRKDRLQFTSRSTRQYLDTAYLQCGIELHDSAASKSSDEYLS